MSTQIQLLKKYGLPIRGHLGQHLLIDPNVQSKIVDCLEVKPGDFVLEIGPGLGALTSLLLQRGCFVVAVEKDKRFIEILEGEFSKQYGDHLKILHQDILKLDFKKHSFYKMSRTWKVLSNMPYYITAPILFWIYERSEIFSRAVLTMQREVAARLRGLPGTKDYGRLTLAARFYADVESLLDIAPDCFRPRPEVYSSVVALNFFPLSKQPKEINRKLLFQVIERAFSQRRKTLFNLFVRYKPWGLSKETVEQIFEEMDLNLKIRGESLLLKDYLNLTQCLEKHLPLEKLP